MLAKNNYQEQIRRQAPQRQHFALRKLTVGVASVLLGCTYLGMSQTVHADTVPTSPAKQSQAAPTSSDLNNQQVVLSAAPSQTKPSQSAPVAGGTTIKDDAGTAPAKDLTQAGQPNSLTTSSSYPEGYYPGGHDTCGDPNISGGGSGSAGGAVCPLLPEGEPVTIKVNIVNIGVPDAAGKRPQPEELDSVDFFGDAGMEITSTSDDPWMTSLMKELNACYGQGYELATGPGLNTNLQDGQWKFKFPRHYGAQYNIYIQPKLDQTTQTKHVTETIHYVFADDGIQAEPDYTKTLTFTQTTTTNEVTKETTTSAWKVDGKTDADKTFQNVKSPKIPNYTPDQPVVQAPQNINQDSKDVEVTVTYTAHHTPVTQTKSVTETIHYVYADGKTAAPDYTKTLTFTETGDRNDSTKATTWNGDWEPASGTFDAVESPTIANYTPDQTSVSAQTVNSSSKGIVKTVVYTPVTTPAPTTPDTPDTETVTQSKQVTETIHYVYADGKTAKPDYTKTLTFTETGTKNLTTGQVAWQHDWQPANDTFDAVESPAITNYTPDQTEIAAQTVTADSADIVKTVIYMAVPDQGQPQPGNPEQPGQPTNPDNPTQPTGPSQPTTPTQPMVPSQPATPTNSAKPGQPMTPATPTVVTPGAKVDQATPMMDPATVTVPGTLLVKPVANAAAQKSARRLPQTGDQHQAGAALIGLALTTTLLGLFGWYRKQA